MKRKNKIKLLPCPFCPQPTERYFAVREVGWLNDRERACRIVTVCSECGAQGPAFGFMSFNNQDTAAQYWNSRASVAAPQGDALELKKLSSRIGDVIEESLRSYRCQYTRELPDLENGLALVDLLTPEPDKDVTRGLQEMELLADYISADVDDAIKAFAAPVTAPVSTGELPLEDLERDHYRDHPPDEGEP